MSDAVPTHAALPTTGSRERVALGLLAATLAVLGGLALTIVIWRAGYVAAISSLAIAFGAVLLYTVAAGSSPRKGLIPLVLLIVLGVVASFFAVVGSDVYDAYDVFHVERTGVGRSEFIRDNIFNGEVLKEYGKDAGLFALFGALGIFGTVRRLLSS